MRRIIGIVMFIWIALLTVSIQRFKGISNEYNGSASGWGCGGEVNGHIISDYS